MKPLDEIKALLGQPAGSFVGTVIALEAGAVTVQTVRGRSRALRPAALILSVGDDVLVSDGNVQGRVKRAVDVPIYRV